MATRQDYREFFKNAHGPLVEPEAELLSEGERTRKARETRTYAWAYGAEQQGDLSALAAQANEVDADQLGTLIVAHPLLEEAVERQGNERLRRALGADEIEVTRNSLNVAEGRNHDVRYIAFGALCGLVVGVVVALCAVCLGAVDFSNVYAYPPMTPHAQVAYTLIAAASLGGVLACSSVRQKRLASHRALFALAGICLCAASLFFMPVAAVSLWLFLRGLQEAFAGGDANLRERLLSRLRARFTNAQATDENASADSVPSSGANAADTGNTLANPADSAAPLNPQDLPYFVAEAARYAQAYRGGEPWVQGLIARLQTADLRSGDNLGAFACARGVLQAEYELDAVQRQQYEAAARRFGWNRYRGRFAPLAQQPDWNWFACYRDVGGGSSNADGFTTPADDTARDAGIPQPGNRDLSDARDMLDDESEDNRAQNDEAEEDDIPRVSWEFLREWRAQIIGGAFCGLVVAAVIAYSMPLMTVLSSYSVETLGGGASPLFIVCVFGAIVGCVASVREIRRRLRFRQPVGVAPVIAAAWHSFWATYVACLIFVLSVLA